MKINIEYFLSRHICLAILMVGMVTGSVFAQDVTLKELIAAADLIVIGKAQTRSINDLVATAEIIPARVLKGSQSQSPIIIKFTVDQDYADALAKSLSRQNRPEPKYHTMWFLKNSEGAGWEALHILRQENIFSYVITVSDLSLPGDFAYDPSATVQAKVIKEFGAQMERAWGQNNEKAIHVRDRNLLLFALFHIDSSMDGAADLAERFSKLNSDRLRSLGLAWGLRGGDSNALKKIETETKTFLVEQESAIASGIGSYQGNAPLFIKGLGKLVNPSFPTRIREEAGRVLRAVHSKEAVPFLAAMLDSDLGNLKYNGVMGLASFAQGLPITTPENVRTGNWLKPEPGSNSATYAVAPQEASRYMPATDTFEKDQTRYTGYWKSWWAKHRSVLEQP